MNLKVRPLTKSFLKRLTVIPAFMIGSFAVLFSSFFQTQKINDIHIDEPPEAIIIGACDLGESSGRFVGKKITVDATVYWTGEHMVVYPTSFCNEGWDGFVFTDLDLADYTGPHQNLQHIIEEKGFTFEMDVRITGIVKRSKDIKKLFYYTIEPSYIEIISPRREFTPKAAS